MYHNFHKPQVSTIYVRTYKSTCFNWLRMFLPEIRRYVSMSLGYPILAAAPCALAKVETIMQAYPAPTRAIEPFINLWHKMIKYMCGRALYYLRFSFYPTVGSSDIHGKGPTSVKASAKQEFPAIDITVELGNMSQTYRRSDGGFLRACIFLIMAALCVYQRNTYF